MIKNLHDIEKIIANVLVKQSQLDNDRIINGLSVRGPELSKYIQTKVLKSYELTDSVIIFELVMDYNQDTNFTEYSNNSIRNTMAFHIELTVYGNESINLANILKARLESQKVRAILLEEGIYLSNISNIASLNEYINETMWLRSNMTLNLIAEMNIDEIDKSEDVEDFSELTYYTV